MNTFQIRVASASELGAVRELWREYWQSLSLPGSFQGFDEELRLLPGPYRGPEGVLLVASVESASVGTGAFRKLNSAACEAKRVYVKPEYRGLGIGQAILARLEQEARQAGYGAMFADTLFSMDIARRLYLKAGFREVPAYSEEPTPEAVYLRKNLQSD